MEMKTSTRVLDFLLRRPVPLAGTSAVLLALAEVSVDWTTWVELHVEVIYGLPLVLAALGRSRRLLWGLVVFLVAMTFAVYVAQIEPGVFTLGEPHFINRVLAAVTLILTGGLFHAWIDAANAVEAQSLSLIHQNEELDRLRRSAEEASGRKTQLLASVSHDIRTPLTTIDLIADLILRSADNPTLAAQLPDLVQRLRRNTRSLADLACALVDVSSLDAGRIGVRSSEFCLNDLLAEEGQRLLPLVQAKSLQLSIQAPEPAVWLLTDRIKLARVLSNLLGNAIKFTAAGSIKLSAVLTSGRALLIEVKDTGVGMTSENLRRIFDEYGQLGNSERDSNQGWGLGLAICRRLVDVMGGKITVQSEPNRGTTFSVHLPASCVIAASTRHGAAAGVTSGSDRTRGRRETSSARCSRG
jgi:signal transduction histidine kinase